MLTLTPALTATSATLASFGSAFIAGSTFAALESERGRTRGALARVADVPGLRCGVLGAFRGAGVSIGAVGVGCSVVTSAWSASGMTEGPWGVVAVTAGVGFSIVGVADADMGGRGTMTRQGVGLSDSTSFVMAMKAIEGTAETIQPLTSQYR
ncbi:hypothetical protein [Couchioplanes caeruleus]|uniref:Uncharacterized protein n=1 Tax=Couchioplanes caeruleus subsp. caeruleus TaxID=56427 RepID=A0A1K0GLQ3_9ACTN|nr:hypothetical protein [Couchioplanes caeruleus]OJF11948.1 hypothetical protein BG844_23380 [Couchioplanes caeruleus subsp. caeruleus]